MHEPDTFDLDLTDVRLRLEADMLAELRARRQTDTLTVGNGRAVGTTTCLARARAIECAADPTSILDEEDDERAARWLKLVVLLRLGDAS